jgi:hypothetical protein
VESSGSKSVANCGGSTYIFCVCYSCRKTENRAGGFSILFERDCENIEQNPSFHAVFSWRSFRDLNARFALQRDRSLNHLDGDRLALLYTFVDGQRSFGMDAQFTFTQVRSVRLVRPKSEALTRQDRNS